MRIGVPQVHLSDTRIRVRPNWVPESAVLVIVGVHNLWVWKDKYGKLEIVEALPIPDHLNYPLFRDWNKMPDVSDAEKRQILKLAAEAKLRI